MIGDLQRLLDESESQYALLLASFKASAGERIRQLFETKCEQTERDHLFEALCDSVDHQAGDSSRRNQDAERLKKVI